MARFLATLLLASVAACAGTTTVVVRDDSPPAHRVERVEYRPGYVFIQGHWERERDHRWAWAPGYYERERPGFVYIEGRYRDDGRAKVWVRGEWRRRGAVVLR